MPGYSVASSLQTKTIALLRRWLWVRTHPSQSFSLWRGFTFCEDQQGVNYIGSTINLERRLTEHLRRGTHTTQRLGKHLETAATLELETIEQARALERQLKGKKNPKLAIAMLRTLHPPSDPA
jgi:predicted GIY-YIG superfamily endonuclease